MCSSGDREVSPIKDGSLFKEDGGMGSLYSNIKGLLALKGAKA